jgi:hypothetical protein
MPKIIVQADQPNVDDAQRAHRRRAAPLPPLRRAAHRAAHVTFESRDSAEGRQLGASVAEENFTIARRLTDWVADTDGEAIRSQEQIHPAKDFAKTLAELGRAFGRLDFAKYDLDAPFPAEAVKYGQNSFRTQAENIARVAREENLSLRETILYFERRILNRSPALSRRSPTRSSGDCWATRPTASSWT